MSRKPNRKFGGFVAGARIEMNITRKDLAIRTGLSYNYISHIENGYETPSDSALERIAKALKIDKNDLYFVAGRIAPEIIHLIVNDAATRQMVLDRLIERKQ